ncbi:protein FAM81B isoform X2 [Tachysurus fulvidraco]|uniref:protein FAM81B isoform X2 n=1 Tax=Tachysurus fulvidraco TaxID=1234273 RepID=UPI001FED3FC9|nr:protein FAM81B isoform X2 [Tachysurus fulvidraco]
MEMSRPEQSLATLLEKAFRIKEDVVNSLHATQGSVLMEASARKLLESHIHIITNIVKQLSKDIQVLEAQIVQRDNIASGTTFAVQSLDHKNLAVVGDLRGRVARCDATIAQLSRDVTAGGQEILKLQQTVPEMHSAIEIRLRDLDLKISESLARLETAQSEQIVSQKNTTREIKRDIQQFEISGLRKLEEEAANIKKWTEAQLSNMAKTQTENRQQLHTLLQDRMVEVEEKLKAQVHLISAHLGHVEKQLEKECSVDRAKQTECKINTRFQAVETSFQAELEQMREEYQSGFQSVHDAIASLKNIADTKAKLDKGELKKDIRQIRRMMVGHPDA